MGLRCPELDACCCVVSLQTGTKMYGFISLISFQDEIYMTITPEGNTHWIYHNTGYHLLFGCMLDLLASIMVFIDDGDPNDDPQRFSADTPFILKMNILSQWFQVLTSILLLIGAFKEKARFVFPWLISSVILVVLQVSFFVIPMIFGNYGLYVPDLIAAILYVTLYSYGWLVVYSYYRAITLPVVNV